MTRVLLAALVALVFGWPAISQAKSASKCVRVVRHASGDMLANGCPACRLVSVQRARPGTGKPTSQTLTVPGRTSQPLPFRGPGHTRITAERPCPGAAPQPLRATSASNDGSAGKCVRLFKSPGRRRGLSQSLPGVPDGKG